MLNLYGKSLSGMAMECLLNWKLPADGVCANVYICNSEKEKNPCFMDEGFVRVLTDLLKYDRTDLFTFVFCGMTDHFYPQGMGDDFWIELMLLSSCGSMKVDTGNGVTARMAILSLIALANGIPVEFVPDNAGGDAHV